MSIELKIKSKHLAEEARIIKFEEAKCKKRGDSATLDTLANHRKIDVRNECRATLLARAFIKGVPYSTVENKRKPEKEHTFRVSILRRVLSMVQKYHRGSTTNSDLIEWLKT